MFFSRVISAFHGLNFPTEKEKNLKGELNLADQYLRQCRSGNYKNLDALMELTGSRPWMIEKLELSYDELRSFDDARSSLQMMQDLDDEFHRYTEQRDLEHDASRVFDDDIDFDPHLDY